MDKKVINELAVKIQTQSDIDRLRELANLAIEGWLKAHETLEGIQDILRVNP